VTGQVRPGCHSVTRVVTLHQVTSVSGIEVVDPDGYRVQVFERNR
jgi:hypothetical protein